MFLEHGRLSAEVIGVRQLGEREEIVKLAGDVLHVVNQLKLGHISMIRSVVSALYGLKPVPYTPGDDDDEEEAREELRLVGRAISLSKSLHKLIDRASVRESPH